MGQGFTIDATLKWRTPDKKLVLVEVGEGASRGYVPSHDLTPAGLRALASACLDAAAHIEGDNAASVEVYAPAEEAVNPVLAQAQQQLAPDRPVIPASALQVQAVPAPSPQPQTTQQADPEVEDLGPPVEVRRVPRAPQGPLPGAPPRPRNVYPSGGYGS